MQHYGSIVIIAILVLFAMYRRVRRTVGFQYLVPRRLTTRIVIFSILAVLILAAGVANPIAYLYDAVGLIIGGIIAYISARTTKFEMRSGRWGYMQHMWIGIGLIVLFVGRLVFRFALISQDFSNIQSQTSASQSAYNSQTLSDPWTAGIFMLLVAYYIGYFAFLLWKAKGLSRNSSEVI